MQTTAISNFPENLNPANVNNGFETQTVKTEVLSINDIKNYEGLPDYAMPSKADFPIVVKTPEGFWCVDGWDIVQAERDNGSKGIKCLVSEISSHSEIELCLRKQATRLRTTGEVLYPEQLLNLNKVIEKIK